MDDGLHKLDDLVLQLKGLLLVRRVRETRGAETGELLMYGAEIDRVRDQLAKLVRTGDLDWASALELRQPPLEETPLGVRVH